MNFMSIEQWMEHLTAAQRDNNLSEFDKAAEQLKDLIKIDKCSIGIETYMKEKDKYMKEQEGIAIDRLKQAVNGSNYEDILNHLEQVVSAYNTKVNDNLLKYMNLVSKYINNKGYLIILKDLKKEQHG